MIAAHQSILAQVHNENSYLEGEADSALDPGTGAVAYKDADGNWHIRQATADEDTKRIVREQRNPPRGGMTVTDTGDSPIDDGYNAGDNVETVGFHRYDRARLRVSPNATADPTDTPVGFDADGLITDDIDGAGATPAAPVGRGIELIERATEDDLLVVEFY
ncbi:hypothetical protein C461_03093 [Halorubrum aidingense JCM 13560]|uniref:Uncharacterized protein n=1 Tax=Halorubrum aidingense JCM 13560 TaxID=1230454 RepID=M0PHC0_9EURY|nr:hypothetical protein [Halorubrum aidingense]EMA69313.1 hypothetical protein C461_03093 [Halorubrum aidingense JCM 13560]